MWHVFPAQFSGHGTNVQKCIQRAPGPAAQPQFPSIRARLGSCTGRGCPARGSAQVWRRDTHLTNLTVHHVPVKCELPGSGPGTGTAQRVLPPSDGRNPGVGAGQGEGSA